MNLSDGGVSGVSGCTTPERSSATGIARHRETYLEFGPLPTAVACARGHTINVLAEWGLRELSDDAALITSELVTNAVAASAALDDRPPIALRLSAGDGRIVIEVWDYSPAGVETFAADDDAESGRGLVIVEALSQAWGESRRGVNRKVVWATLESAVQHW